MIVLQVPQIDASAALRDFTDMDEYKDTLPKEMCYTLATMLREEVSTALLNWKPSPQAIEVWPALKWLPQTAATITSSIRVDPGDDGTYQVWLDTERMERLGVPPELVDALEHGSGLLAPMAPQARVGLAFESLVDDVTRSVANRIEQGARR